ncbi:hypothetical protein [Jannaschia pohangensis]|uniref:Uncharacterized protein n=1 Tax=Jannaschia pohangensis TaxID=390807 RepID=A0A1I3QWH1_9RHOB|nr:hypothetical protein [Jannaschia pohangensis]SFJ37819.1 hypothetical protein SAMN04488095_2678 [Jannaschia pohangensis]
MSPKLLRTVGTGLLLVALLDLSASAALAQDAGDPKVPDLAGTNTLADMIRALPAPELRQLYRANYPVSNVHVVAPLDGGVVEGLDAFFASYPEEVPPGLTVVVTPSDASGTLYGEVYQCPAEGEHCVFDPARPRDTVPDAAMPDYSSQRMTTIPFGPPGLSADDYDIATDRDGRLSGSYRAILVAATNELDSICLTVDFHAARFFGLSEAEPVSVGFYCYNFPLQRITTSLTESSFGYIPTPQEAARLRADFEAVTGLTLTLD